MVFHRRTRAGCYEVKGEALWQNSLVSLGLIIKSSCASPSAALLTCQRFRQKVQQIGIENHFESFQTISLLLTRQTVRWPYCYPGPTVKYLLMITDDSIVTEMQATEEHKEQWLQCEPQGLQPSDLPCAQSSASQAQSTALTSSHGECRRARSIMQVELFLDRR